MVIDLLETEEPVYKDAKIIKYSMLCNSKSFTVINEEYHKVNKTNKNRKMCSFKSSENIQKKKGEPDRSVSDNQSSSFLSS